MSGAKLGVSYFGVRNPQHVAEDLRCMVEAGCNVVLHTFSEEDYRFYLETMADIVALSKGLGLEVYIDPWGVGGVFGGEAFTWFALEHDEARQVLVNGKKAPAACPNSGAFQEFMQKWVAAAVDIGADVVFWDEPHFFLPEWYGQPKELWACHCPNCRELFRREYGYPLPREMNPDVLDFRDRSLFRFLRMLTEAAKARGVRTALCLLPEWESLESVRLKWEKYAALPSLDLFGSDPYWLWAGRTFAEYERVVRVVKELADRFGKEPQIWVQACKVRAGDEEQVRRSVETAYAFGVRNILAWSFLGTAYMSWVRSDQPEKVWAELTRAFRAIREKEERCQTSGSAGAS
ncbi:MAG: hypothetical protein ABDI20_05185 [Candidatus Bipolaricaulaceae bacterium]